MITVLRHKRHDWMNQIQLIQGYASLGKQDRLMEQLEEVKEEAEQERRLLNSGAPHFSLWLLSFNWKQEQFRLRFQLKEEDIDLSRHDSVIIAYVKRMLELLDAYKVEGELYEGTLFVYQGYQPSTFSLSWEWEGPFLHAEELKQKLDQEGFISTMFEDRELSIEMTIE